MADLKVISRTSVMRFKGTQKTLREIGRELGVDTVLEGSVRRAGSRLRIVSTLVDVETERQLWAESFDRTMKDVFAIQTEVAQQIATALKASLSPDQLQRLGQVGPKKMEAYHLYLKGRYFMNKLTFEGIQKGIDYFQEALELDPTYAPSYAGISTCYANCGHFSYLSPGQSFPKAKAAAGKALELDSSLAEARASMAVVLFFYDWNWDAAERDFLRAIELNSNFAEAHTSFSWYLCVMGRFEEAIAEARRALELDPLSLFVNVNLGSVLSFSARYDEAIEQLNRTLEMDPNFLHAKACLATAYRGKNMYEEAIDILSKWSWSKSHVGQAYALAGKAEAARKVLEEVLDPSQKGHHSSYDIGSIYLFLGETDQALEWLEKAYQERDNKITFLNEMLKQMRQQYPDKAALFTDPRFDELIRRVGLDP